MDLEDENLPPDPLAPLPLANLTDGRIAVSTGPMPTQRGDPADTRPMILAPEPEPPPPAPAAALPPRPMPFCCWVAVASSLTSVALAVLLWIKSTPPAAPVPAPAVPAAAPAGGAPPAQPEAFQAAMQPYVDAAAKGDVNAMRMLGAMYYHGLDLPRNREEGLKWYRKAAASGSKVAEDELKQME